MKHETRIVLKYKPGSKQPLKNKCGETAFVGESHAVSGPLNAVEFPSIQNAQTFQEIIKKQGDDVDVTVLKITIEELTIEEIKNL